MEILSQAKYEQAKQAVWPFEYVSNVFLATLTSWNIVMGDDLQLSTTLRFFPYVFFFVTAMQRNK